MRTGAAIGIDWVDFAAAAPELVDDVSVGPESSQVQSGAAAIVACIQLAARRSHQQGHRLRPALPGGDV